MAAHIIPKRSFQSEKDVEQFFNTTLELWKKGRAENQNKHSLG